jgi:hypothetical protein
VPYLKFGFSLRVSPPRWCDWTIFAQMASSFGLLLDVDWASLFIAFYERMRIKIACRNPSKIPKEILFEWIRSCT